MNTIKKLLKRIIIASTFIRWVSAEKHEREPNFNKVVRRIMHPKGPHSEKDFTGPIKIIHGIPCKTCPHWGCGVVWPID